MTVWSLRLGTSHFSISGELYFQNTHNRVVKRVLIITVMIVSYLCFGMLGSSFYIYCWKDYVHVRVIEI